jgi:hypothetical protein
MPEMVMKGICVFRPRWFLHRRDKNTENECLSPEEERPEGERPEKETDGLSDQIKISPQIFPSIRIH